MTVIGLTGGIASGKSTASHYLKTKGFAIIDADLIARQILEPGKPAYEAVKSFFGESYFNADGTLNRKALGQRVFSVPQDLEALNQMTHPHILEEIKKQLDEYRCQLVSQWVILDAALLFELHLESWVDAVWYIDVSQEVQHTRLIARDQLQSVAAKARIESQWEASKKRALATVVIDNNGTKEALFQQLDGCIEAHRFSGGMSG